MIQREYPIAVHFSPRFTCGDSYRTARDAIAGMPGALRRSTALKHAVDADALLAQLAAAATCDAGVIVGRRRYSQQMLSNMDALVDKLAAAEIIVFSRGHQLPYGILSRIYPGSKFPKDIVPSIVRHRPQQMHPSIRGINAKLARMDIHYPGTAWWLADSRQLSQPYLDGTSCRELTRVFARYGKRLEGGRMYGAFWVNQKRAERKRVLLGGKAIVEVDMQAAVPRICYALSHHPWPFDDCDPYTAGEGPRPAWKALTNAMMSSSRVIRHWPEKMLPQADSPGASLLEHGWKLPQAIAAVKAKHPALHWAWHTGAAMRTQRIESDIVISALKQLYREGIPALPVHDAIYVAAEHAEIVRPLLEIPSQL